MYSSTQFARRVLAAASAAMIISFAVPGIKVRHGAAGPRLLEASEPTPADRQTGLEQSIAAREYEATDAGQGLQAPNRAQGIRTYFEPGGARIVDRETAGDELARVRTVSVGRGAAVRQVDSGEVSADGARVEVRRPGLVESFENTEGGLEHGYTLLDKPDDTGPLSIEIAFDGASARVDDNKATLTTTGGRRFEYGGLAAWDASGAALDSRMEAADDGHVRLVVDDASAAYPITVDPTLTSPAHATLHSDQASANTVGAGAGDVNGDGYDDIIVGSPSYDLGETDEGAVFVFLGGPQGITSGTPASASATLQSDQMGAHFGSPLAGAGDVNGDGYADIIVGANNYSAGQSYEGAAFVFLGGPGGIASGTIATAATTLQSDQIDAAMGSAVAGAGDVNGDGYADVIVGALGYDGDGATDEGAAFVFVGGPSGVSSGSPATAYATLQSDQTSAFMGDSVAGAGDVNGDGYADVIVGASFYDHGQTDEGAAFVFLGSQFGILGGNPTSAAAVLESDQINAEMNNVAGAGDVNSDGFADVIVCSNRYSAGQSHEGAAFIFMGSPAGIVSGTPATASATLESDQVDANLGSVTGVGDVNDDGYADVMVGAPYYDADQTDEGAAFVFLGGASGVASGGPSAASSILRCHQSIAYFGSVAGAGDVNGDGYADVIVTAVNYNAGLNAEGAAFVYQGGPFGLEGYPVPAATMQSDQGSAFSGTSVAGAGDVNGDGYADVIVGAPFYDAGQSDEGAAFVFLGGPSGITGTSPSTAASFLQSNQTGAHMGQSVASAGDVNGDGYADVIVGANKYHSGQTDEGAAFVFLGGPNGISGDSPATASAIVESDQMGAQMGYSVAGAGDVNNDGYDDVIVGAFAFVINAPDEGEAFIFLGGPSGVASATPATAATTLQAVGSSLLGFSVAGAGDVNGDGYSDVIVGAQYFSNGQTDEGGAFVFLGGPTGVSSGTTATASASLQSDQASAHCGTSVAGAGDVNGDGYSDVIIGAPDYNAGQTFEGAAFVFLGGPSGIANGTPATAASTLQSDQASALMGLSVAEAGDVNGDGYADVIVDAPYYREGLTDVGEAFIFLGGPSGVASGSPRTAAVTLARYQTNSEFGISVAGAGDVNGDGLSDVIVGANHYADGQVFDGAVFVYMPGACCVGRSSSDSVGVYNQLSGAWFLRNTNTSGVGQIDFNYGQGGRGYIAITGDWDGDGLDTPGLYDPVTGTFFLRDSSSPGPADNSFVFGAGGRTYLPVAGDWDGDGTDTIGLYNPTTGSFFLKNTNSGGSADLTFVFGVGGAGWIPIAGDWDGDGTATIGLYAPLDGAFFLKNTNASGPADLVFNFGPVGVAWTPVTGDFDGDGTDTIGLYVPSSGSFFLKNQNTYGAADVTFTFGGPNMMPLMGDWDGQIHRTQKNR